MSRRLISEGTREGLARARSSGRKLGRPKGSLARGAQGSGLADAGRVFRLAGRCYASL